jgi:hypothetical protein
MAKTTTPLTAQERVILFCPGTGVAACWHHRGCNAPCFGGAFLDARGRELRCQI